VCSLFPRLHFLFVLLRSTLIFTPDPTFFSDPRTEPGLLAALTTSHLRGPPPPPEANKFSCQSSRVLSSPSIKSLQRFLTLPILLQPSTSHTKVSHSSSSLTPIFFHSFFQPPGLPSPPQTIYSAIFVPLYTSPLARSPSHQRAAFTLSRGP